MKSKIKTVGKWAFIVVGTISILLWVYSFYALLTAPLPVAENFKYEFNTIQRYEDGSFSGELVNGTQIVGCTNEGICWQNNGKDLE